MIFEIGAAFKKVEICWLAGRERSLKDFHQVETVGTRGMVRMSIRFPWMKPIHSLDACRQNKKEVPHL